MGLECSGYDLEIITSISDSHQPWSSRISRSSSTISLFSALGLVWIFIHSVLANRTCDLPVCILEADRVLHSLPLFNASLQYGNRSTQATQVQVHDGEARILDANQLKFTHQHRKSFLTCPSKFKSTVFLSNSGAVTAIPICH
jgi:hypothetical protein